MNKLYLLVALGLSVVNAQSSSDVTDTGTDDDDDSYYEAGDCLDETTMDSTYGFVDFNCGSDCATNQSDFASGDDSWASGGADDDTYDFCYGDDDCNSAADECDGDLNCTAQLYCQSG
jgi:hypothetical protein